jgi:hypothetical protein
LVAVFGQPFAAPAPRDLGQVVHHVQVACVAVLGADVFHFAQAIFLAAQTAFESKDVIHENSFAWQMADTRSPIADGLLA